MRLITDQMSTGQRAWLLDYGKELFGLSHRATNAVRFSLLHFFVAGGYSLAQEGLRAYLNFNNLSWPRSSFTKILLEDLPGADLLEKQVLRLVGQSKIALLRPRERCRTLFRQMGWELPINEWELMIKQHAGDRYVRHTTLVLYFAYQARLRGWNVQLLPPAARYVEPDAFIHKGSRSILVEVERKARGKTYKWSNFVRLQPFVAICTTTKYARAKLGKECRRLSLPHVMTDIEYLIGSSKNRPYGPLWVESWRFDLPEEIAQRRREDRRNEWE